MPRAIFLCSCSFFFFSHHSSLALFIYSQLGNSLWKFLYSELIQAWKDSFAANIETVHNFPNLWISFITLFIKMLHTEAVFCLIAATCLLNWTSLIHQPQIWKPRQYKQYYPWKCNQYYTIVSTNYTILYYYYFPCLVINSMASEQSNKMALPRPSLWPYLRIKGGNEIATWDNYYSRRPALIPYHREPV